MPSPKIRRATGADAVGLAHCIDAAYLPHKERISDLPPVSEGIDGDIERNIVWVAEMDGEVVGGLVLVPGEHHAVLANLAVNPEHSGHGLGKKLIDHAEHFCRERGIKELRLSTHKDMPGNVSLYEHLGWVVSGTPGNKIRMTRSL